MPHSSLARTALAIAPSQLENKEIINIYRYAHWFKVCASLAPPCGVLAAFAKEVGLVVQKNPNE